MRARLDTSASIRVVKLNLLDGPKLIKKQVGISWTTFWVSVILIVIMSIAPIVTMKVINGSLVKKVSMLNKTYASLKKKENEFKQVIKQKEEVVKFIDTTYSIINAQPKLSIVMDEVRKRLPKGTIVQGGMNFSVRNDEVFLSLKVISDSYLDAPLLIESFASSPYLYVKDAKVVPLNVSSISRSEKDKWSYSVNLVLGWKQEEKVGDEK